MKATFICVITVLAIASANSAAHAITFTYSLDGSFAEDSNSGPSLVPQGGTLGPTGYSFGPNTGLSLSGTGVLDEYSISIRFYFDSVTASFNGYQRILDFKNRAFDEGLYSRNGSAEYFVGCCSGPGGTGGASAGLVFASGTFADLLVTRSAAGLFSVSVNNTPAFSFMDTTGLATLSGPNNILHFFMDDFESLANFPNTPEAGFGFIDSIRFESPQAVPLSPSIVLQLIGLGVLGLFGWHRKRKAVG
jgi:hypothetical protein